jgi:insulysin
MVKLQYLIINTVTADPDTDKSAASMDVRIGSFAEPDNLLGLAHFCGK